MNKQIKWEIMQNNEEIKFVVPFYTQERWQNWIISAKESYFKANDQEKGAIFVNMEDDIVLACLKLVSKYDKKLLSEEDALKQLTEIKEIVLKKIESINEDIDMMFESIQTSLIGVFASFECYIIGKYQKKSINKLLKSVIKAEKDNEMDVILDIVAEIGANIIAGKSLKGDELDNIPEGIVAELLDGIDSIGAAMAGDNSYKYDEPDNENI